MLILTNYRFVSQIIRNHLQPTLAKLTKTYLEIKIVSIKYKAVKEEIVQTHPAPELDKALLKSMTRERKAMKHSFLIHRWMSALNNSQI